MIIYRVFTDTKSYNEKLFRDFTKERTAREFLSRKGWEIQVIVK